MNMISLDQNNLKKSPGINGDVTIKIVEYLNNLVINRNSPLFIYVHPGIQFWAAKLQFNEKDIFNSLKYLSCHCKEVKFKAILHVNFDDLEYMLQDDDLEELEAYGTVHNPNNPTIVYKNAKNYIKHAFVINYEPQ